MTKKEFKEWINENCKRGCIFYNGKGCTEPTTLKSRTFHCHPDNLRKCEMMQVALTTTKSNNGDVN